MSPKMAMVRVTMAIHPLSSQDGSILTWNLTGATLQDAESAMETHQGTMRLSQ